jgi:glycosyltransferase involved in cell wall biosynthesis
MKLNNKNALSSKVNTKKELCVIGAFTSPSFSGRVSTELFVFNKAFRAKASVSDRKTYLHSKGFLHDQHVERYLNEPDYGDKRLWVTDLAELPESGLTKGFWAYVSFCPFNTDKEQIKKLKGADRLWVPSKQHKLLCVKHGIAEEKIIVLPLPGFDKSRITGKECPSKYQKKSGVFRFLVTGSPTNKKGIEEALYAYIKEFKANERVELLIKLTHYPNLKKNISFEIANLKKKLGALNKMFAQVTVIHEILSSDDYAGLIQSADAYIYAGKALSSGLSLAEAMSCGIPVITHEKPAKILGLTEEAAYIAASAQESLEEGLLYTNSPKTTLWAVDKDALAETLRRAYTDREGRAKRGEKGRELARALPSWHQVAQSIIEAL